MNLCKRNSIMAEAELRLRLHVVRQNYWEKCLATSSVLRSMYTLPEARDCDGHNNFVMQETRIIDNCVYNKKKLIRELQ